MLVQGNGLVSLSMWYGFDPKIHVYEKIHTIRKGPCLDTWQYPRKLIPLSTKLEDTLGKKKVT